jgi:hypothetical protein
MAVARPRLKARFVVLGIAVVVAIATIASLPPRALSLPVDGAAEPVRGVVHVHTRESDGTGTVDQVAEAAARSGLKFIVLTDHGNGLRVPAPPSYRSGVLCIDALEVTSSDGHVVALGLWGPTPYPLGAESQAVVEDIARLGGMSIAAHPSSRKSTLEWKTWDPPVDGLEWLNADSEWRDEGYLSLARALLTYPWRRPETLAMLLDRPAAVLQRWDTMTERRRVVALGGADAHANLKLPGSSPTLADGAFSVPGYDASFRTFSVALPSLQLTGDADADARAIVREIRSGHVYSSIDAMAGPARLSFTATSGGRTASGGDDLVVNGPVAIRATTNAPPGARITLLGNGRDVASADGPTLEYDAPSARAAYRIEAYLPGSTIPWLLSNPIYVGGVQENSTTPESKPVDTLMQYNGGELDRQRWGVEKNDRSLGEVDMVDGAREGTRLLFRYALGGSSTESPWLALGMRSGPDIAKYDRVIFTARSDEPVRLWVALWMPIPTGNIYWRRSVYLDSMEREIAVRFADMRPVAGAPPTPPMDQVQSVMFIIDQTNTRLGGTGRIWMDDIRYGR